MKTHAPLLFLALALMAHGAAAEEKTSKASEKSEVVYAAEDFMKDFDKDSRRHFTMIYSNYNLLKVVETVQDDVEMAVEKCGDVNADMEETLEARYKTWAANIKPVLADAEQNVNNMVNAQDYAKPKEIKGFFKQIDKARKEQSKGVEKMPVTSKEACEHLLKTMDTTEEQLIKLLQATLVSAPQSVQKALEDREAAEKAAAEKAKAEEEAAAKAAEEKEKSEEKASEEPSEEKVKEESSSEKASEEL